MCNKFIKVRNAAKRAAAVCLALTLCSCGSQAAGFTPKADIDREEYTYTETPEETTAETTPQPEETTEATTTTAPPETTTEVTTTEPPKPVGLQDGVLDGHRFGVTKFSHKVYSNTKVKKAFAKLDDICDDYGGTISFAYKNLSTGTIITYNADTKYGICSTVKAPFCKNLLAKRVDPKDEINISVIWDQDGGEVAKGGIGKTYTTKELIRLAITQSDNSAYYNLVNYYGYESFNKQCAQLGVSYNLGSSWIFNYGTANDLLKQYVDIYKYAAKTERGKWLVKLMTKTELESQITAALGDKYPVAHKYGSDWDQKCYHDCAICYADSPFVLIIMTSQEPETKESDKVFHKLAKQFDIINDQIVAE